MRLSTILFPLVLFTILLGGCQDQALASADADHGPNAMTIALKDVAIDAGGVIVIAVYDNQSAFDSQGQPLAWFTVPPDTQAIALHGLASRPIAIAAFHDANVNGVFDEKDGIPLEGWGNSGDIGKWMQPSYNDVLVEANRIAVQMHYLD